jgi:hypothetical protein
MTPISPQQRVLERKVLEELSTEEVWKHLNRFEKIGQRLAGTPEAEHAVEYIKQTLETYGLKVTTPEFDAFTSIPLYSSLKVISPATKEIESVAFSHSATTDEEGLVGEIVPVGPGGDEDYDNLDVKGKIAVAEQSYAPFMTEKVRFAEKHGAIGVIIVNWGTPEYRSIGMGVATSVWGNPTPESMKMMPHIPVISVTNPDGADLVAMCKNGNVRVRIKAKATMEWIKVREPVVFIKGTSGSDKYVLFAGHLDAWGAGTTCNATGDALLLEMARVLSRCRDQLKRSVMIAWWLPHENLYNGSTWYVDNHWDDLNKNLIAYYNIDSPGIKGTSIEHYYSRNFSEMRKFQEQCIKDAADIDGKSLRWPYKTSDQSLWGMGIPSVLERTNFPPEVVTKMKGATLGWFYHSSQDTMDQADPKLFDKVLRSYTLSALRLCNFSILPFDFTAVADEFAETLSALQKQGKGAVALDNLIAKAEQLNKQASILNDITERILNMERTAINNKANANIDSECNKINDCLMKLCRILNPILYSYVGKYDHDLAAAEYLKRPIPILQPVSKLATLDSNSDEFKMLKTKLIREKNKVSDALEDAIDLIKCRLDRIIPLG